MTVHMMWDDPEKTILHFEFERDWKLAEFEARHIESLDWVKAQPHNVHVVVDFSQLITLPVNALSSFENLTRRYPRPANIDVIVVVARKNFFMRLLDIYTRVFNREGTQILTANTIEEARQVLAGRVKGKS